jgi:hypothetical protein
VNYKKSEVKCHDPGTDLSVFFPKTEMRAFSCAEGGAFLFRFIKIGITVNSGYDSQEKYLL